MPASKIYDDGLSVLDFSDFYSQVPERRTNLVFQIRDACQKTGFFQITNHGIPMQLQNDVMQATRAFFDISSEEKMKLDRHNNTWFRGYESFGSQILEKGTNPENKEGFYIGRDLPLTHPHAKAGRYACGPNFWPESLGENFSKISMLYFDSMFSLSQDIMEALALGLGLEKTWFKDLNRDAMAIMRYIHYPPSTSNLEDERGIGAHRDFGTITILMQDDVGGLQVLNEDNNTWFDVTPISGALVVNLGNVMMRWTNHKYHSATHRVINKSGRHRYSIPFFYNGDPTLVINCIPGCENDGKGSRYEPIIVSDYLDVQFDESYVN